MAQIDLTANEKKTIPPLYSQEDKGDDAVVYVKFFSPFMNWTWYATEFDGEDTFFGMVDGEYAEMGYFSMREMRETTRMVGGKRLPLIERDEHWEPKTLGEVKKNLRGIRI